MKLLSLYRAKKSYLLNSVISAFVIALLFVVIDAFQEWKEPKPSYLRISMKSSVNSIAQIFYDIGNKFNEKDSKSCKVFRSEKFKVLHFPLPKVPIQDIRFDPLKVEGKFSLRDIFIVDEFNELIQVIELQRVIPLQQISSININNNSLMAVTEANANDPILSLNIEYPISLNLKSPLILRIKDHIVGMFDYSLKKFCFVFVISLAALLFAYSGKKLNIIINLL